jgi:hypothetical protein
MLESSVTTRRIVFGGKMKLKGTRRSLLGCSESTQDVFFGGKD